MLLRGYLVYVTIMEGRAPQLVSSMLNTRMIDISGVVIMEGMEIAIKWVLSKLGRVGLISQHYVF
jgi:hypothetical protein